MKKVLPVSAIIAFLCITCFYDNEEYLYPSINNACDTTSITFTGTISVMLSNNCLSCHSNSTAANFGNNIRLEDYADVKTSSQRLLGSIKQESGFSPMPKGGAKLNECLITQFGIWVKNGTPNN
jgi:hypothetical protein